MAAREHAAARPRQKALVQGERSVTWVQLDAMADRVAASLQRDGLQPRQAISICAANSLEYAAVFLGVCDKIVPGLVIAALTFGHLPAVFIPAGPMPSGMPNMERSKARQLYAEKKITREEMLRALREAKEKARGAPAAV